MWYTSPFTPNSLLSLLNVYLRSDPIPYQNMLREITRTSLSDVWISVNYGDDINDMFFFKKKPTIMMIILITLNTASKILRSKSFISMCKNWNEWQKVVNNTSSQNDLSLIETSFRFIKKMLLKETCNLLYSPVEVWSVHPEFESAWGFCFVFYWIYFLKIFIF